MWRPLAALLVMVILSACSTAGPAPAHVATPTANTHLGPVAFSPADASTELDPGQTVVTVRALASDKRLDGVIIQQDNGPVLVGQMVGGQYRLDRWLVTDARYTVTAIVTSLGSDGRPGRRSAMTSTFSTATTPRIASVNPPTIGSGQSAVISLIPAASTVTVEGPVKSQLSTDGSSLTVTPLTYEQGKSYNFTVTPRNLKGVLGLPQTSAISTAPPPNSIAQPDTGSSNIGVAIPLVLGISAPAADKADLARHVSVTVESRATAAPGQGACASFGVTPPTGQLAVDPVWTTPKRLRLVPKTPDGYWPANSTIKMVAKLKDLKTDAGSWFTEDETTTFTTGDKRVLDVDLGTQTLTACRNGAQDQQFLVSTGAPAHPTATGNFFIDRRVADEEMKNVNGPFAPDYYDIKHVPWTQYFDGGAALHGAWWHNSFGTPLSHGCVGLQTPTQNSRWPDAKPQAEYLWKFDSIGDPVVIHGVTPGLSPAAQPAE